MENEIMESVDTLREALMKVVLANLGYLLYSGGKTVLVIYVIITEEESCLQIDLWFYIMLFFEIIFALYFLSAIFAHHSIYNLKKKNILNPKYFNLFIAVNQNPFKSNSILNSN